MILRWFFSKTVRQAVDFHRHVKKILKSQRDLLSPEAITNVRESLEKLRMTVRTSSDKVEIQNQVKQAEAVANKYLKPYPHALFRENFEVLLVAIAVAMGVRTFFLQPFKIPTGSMQPTLFGVTSENYVNEPNFKVPTGLSRFVEWVHGNKYVQLKAKADGAIEEIQEKPWQILIFNIYQKVKIGGVWHTLWFPPDFGGQDLMTRAGLTYDQQFQKGETVIKLKVKSGDHLFVDRLTYNFRHPRRGEIIVFETRNISPDLRGDQFYIKRLIGLPEEKVQIGNDQHLIINGEKLDASDYHFENVYSFDPSKKHERDHYFGHVNETVARKNGRSFLAPMFRDENDVFNVRPEHFLAFGDNTMDSSDSRTWGDLNRTNVIGKAFFVYWPISTRFGPAPR